MPRLKNLLWVCTLNLDLARPPFVFLCPSALSSLWSPEVCVQLCCPSSFPSRHLDSLSNCLTSVSIKDTGFSSLSQFEQVFDQNNRTLGLLRIEITLKHFIQHPWIYQSNIRCSTYKKDRWAPDNWCFAIKDDFRKHQENVQSIPALVWSPDQTDFSGSQQILIGTH